MLLGCHCFLHDVFGVRNISPRGLGKILRLKDILRQEVAATEGLAL